MCHSHFESPRLTSLTFQHVASTFSGSVVSTPAPTGPATRLNCCLVPSVSQACYVIYIYILQFKKYVETSLL